MRRLGVWGGEYCPIRGLEGSAFAGGEIFEI